MLERDLQDNTMPIDAGRKAAWVFSESDFDSIASLAKTYFGLNLSRTKLALIQSRLGQRMRQLGLDSFSQYMQRLEGPSAKDERTKLLSALTTNVTHFFREQHHFDALRATVLPPLLEKAAAGQRVRIWSAGCSKGPEPYSLAMTLLDMCPDVASMNVKILATDIDPDVIETAKTGQYPAAEFEGVPKDLRAKFVTGARRDDEAGTVTQNAQSLITFGVLNLIEPLPFGGPFDLIFCRNVTIYFDRDTQAKVWRTFSDVMTPQGHLFIGHSEHLTGEAKPDFNKIGFTMYQRAGM